MVRLSRITAGVVGVGFIGVAHIEALRRLGIDVAGVVGSSPERGRAKAEAADLPDVYDSVEALAADPNIDVIHVASPNNVHADQVRVCLDAGKNVWGSWQRFRDVERRSTPRSSEDAAYGGSRDDPALAPKCSAICRPRRWAGSAKREAKRKTTCVFVTWAAALPGPPSPAAGDK